MAAETANSSESIRCARFFLQAQISYRSIVLMIRRFALFPSVVLCKNIFSLSFFFSQIVDENSYASKLRGQLSYSFDS